MRLRRARHSHRSQTHESTESRSTEQRRNTDPQTRSTRRLFDDATRDDRWIRGRLLRKNERRLARRDDRRGRDRSWRKRSARIDRRELTGERNTRDALDRLKQLVHRPEALLRILRDAP